MVYDPSDLIPQCRTHRPAFSSSGTSVVKLDHVRKEYLRGHATVVALRDVSVEIVKGEFCALMGPSGCGKSTLLNLIAGLDRPTAGSIFFDGHCTDRFTDTDWTRVRRESVGMIFQAFHLLPGLTAGENVALPLMLTGTDDGTVRKRVAASLEMVGLLHRAEHKPGELSGGEQKRVAIARALVHRPRLLLADEPTGNLDSQTGADIMGLLKSLQQRGGQTVLLATHSREAARQADRICQMKDGELQC